LLTSSFTADCWWSCAASPSCPTDSRLGPADPLRPGTRLGIVRMPTVDPSAQQPLRRVGRRRWVDSSSHFPYILYSFVSIQAITLSNVLFSCAFVLWCGWDYWQKGNDNEGAGKQETNDGRETMQKDIYLRQNGWRKVFRAVKHPSDTSLYYNTDLYTRPYRSEEHEKRRSRLPGELINVSDETERLEAPFSLSLRCLTNWFQQHGSSLPLAHTHTYLYLYTAIIYIEGRAPIQSDGCWEKKEKKKKSEKFWMWPRSTRLSYVLQSSEWRKENKEYARNSAFILTSIATSMVPIFQPDYYRTTCPGN
jgi:hypothetical protein